MRDRNLAVGDSITEGFNDGGLNNDVPYAVVSCLGYPGRFRNAAIATPASNLPDFVNFGQSGSMVPDYLRRAKGLIEADPGKFTMCFYSIWSPNTPTPGDPAYAFLQSTLDELYALALDFRDYLVSKSIIPQPVFLFASPYGTADFQRVRLKNFVDAVETAMPYGHYPGKISSALGGTADPTYLANGELFGTPTVDATHPEGGNGYNIIYQYILSNYAAKRALAISTLGFQE